MAALSKQDLVRSLTRLGELAASHGDNVELVLVGGSLMVLVFDARQSTRDVDVVILSPADISRVRNYARSVGDEMGWAADWLNDAVKGFMVGISHGPVVFNAPGIVVHRPFFSQLLAMKLSAWRDDVDISDARRLLRELSGAYDDVWQQILPFLQPGVELKAKYAF
jgi:hypothetical protein